MLSTLICGELEDVRYVWEECVRGNYRLFHQQKGPHSSGLIKTEIIGDITRIDRKIFKKNDSYVVPVNEFHETNMARPALTATLCCFVGKSDDPPRVAAPLRTEVLDAYQPRALSGDLKRSTIERVLAYL